MTIMDTLRRLSGREPASPAAGTASPREANPWRGVFDPNSNPNAGGREMYDTVDDPKSSPTTWDYHLQAEKAAATDVKQAAFQAMGAQNDALDASSLKKLFASDRVEHIMAMADKNKDGKIDFKEFCDLIREHPCE